jgi:hypothetical protein
MGASESVIENKGDVLLDFNAGNNTINDNDKLVNIPPVIKENYRNFTNNNYSMSIFIAFIIFLFILFLISRIIK